MQFTHTANPVPVHAAIILDVSSIPFPASYVSGSPQFMLRLSDGRNYEASSSMTARYTPVVGDYLVTQEDGYEYLTPKDVFERKYRPISAATPAASTTVDPGLMEGYRGDFGFALSMLKAGERVARDGWNGKDMWLSLSCNPGGTAAAGSREIAAENFWSNNNSEYARQNGGSAVVLPCITMKTASGEILMGWLASQTDMLAEDWFLI